MNLIVSVYGVLFPNNRIPVKYSVSLYVWRQINEYLLFICYFYTARAWSPELPGTMAGAKYVIGIF